MDYWAETMQDDCYLIATDGWKAETYRIIERDKKGKERDKGWACDLVPKSLIIARYFTQEQEVITHLEAELESVAARMNELEEEHGGEDGVFSALDKWRLVADGGQRFRGVGVPPTPGDIGRGKNRDRFRGYP